MLRRSAHFLMFCFCSSSHESAGLPRNPSIMYISRRRCRAFQAAYALHRSKARPAPENLQLHHNFHNFNLNHRVSENGGYMGILPHEGSKNNYMHLYANVAIVISPFLGLMLSHFQALMLEHRGDIFRVSICPGWSGSLSQSLVLPKISQNDTSVCLSI